MGTEEIIGLALTVIAVAAVVFRKRLRAGFEIFGVKFFVDGTAEEREGVRVTKSKSRTGGLRVSDKTGRGAVVDRVDVEKDIDVKSGDETGETSPKA